MTRLELPLPPSANQLWRVVGSRVVKSSAYRSWLEIAGFELLRQRPVAVPSPVAVSLVLRGRVYLGRDLDNFAKPVLDLLRHHEVIAGDNLTHVRRVQLDFAACECEPVLMVAVGPWEDDGEGLFERG